MWTFVALKQCLMQAVPQLPAKTRDSKFYVDTSTKKWLWCRLNNV